MFAELIIKYPFKVTEKIFPEPMIKAECTYSFEIIYKGSEFLIDEFPKSKDYYEETEEKIEKI